MAGLLTQEFPSLSKKVLGSRSAEVVPIGGDMWETRIEPLLYELKEVQGVQIFSCTVEGQEVGVMSNDEALVAALRPSHRKLGFVPKPSFNLYVFSGMIHLSALRRFKDYPDETPREDLEAFWLAECAENRSVIVLNRDR